MAEPVAGAPPTASPPTPGDGATPPGDRIYTHDEMQTKMRGQGTALKAEQERSRQFEERSRKFEEELAKLKGTTDDLRTQRETELTAEVGAARERAEAAEKRWTGHLKVQQKALSDRLEKLPEDRRPASVLPLLTPSAPLSTSKQLLHWPEKV